MIDPRTTDMETWFAALAPATGVIPQDDWRQAALALNVQSPNPYDFNDWRAWAEAASPQLEGLI